jgi:hypothetical protein
MILFIARIQSEVVKRLRPFTLLICKFFMQNYFFEIQMLQKNNIMGNFAPHTIALTIICTSINDHV